MQREAFSLIEMIAVIAIIGILSAIGLPIVNSFNASSTVGRAKSNAQRLAHIYSVSLIAGHDFAAGETQIEDVVQKIVEGTTVQAAEFAETLYFGLPTISTALQTEAIEFLEMRHGRLLYKPIE